MFFKLKWVKPWYDVKVSYEYWAYYDESIRVFFCFARKGKGEIQGESTADFETAHRRLSAKIENIPPIESFVWLNRKDLMVRGTDMINF